MAVMYFNEKLNRVVIVNYSSDPFNKYEIIFISNENKTTFKSNHAKFGRGYTFLGVVGEELVSIVNTPYLDRSVN